MSHPIMMAFLLFYVGLIYAYADPGGIDFEAMREEVAKKLAVLRKLEAQDMAEATVKPPLVNYGKKVENLDVSDANQKPEPTKRKWKNMVVKPYDNFVSITKANENFTDFLYDGDIFLTPEKLDKMIAERTGRLQKRLIHIESWNWNKYEIPYYFVQFPYKYYEIVRRAFAEYERVTCLRFKEIPFYPYNIPFGQTYLQITQAFGCSSSVGRQNAQRHTISLAEGCVNERTILHEIGHALGFIHTHNRPDRNAHVTVILNNAVSHRDQFNRSLFQTENNPYPYDYMSIMHYHDTAFSPQDMFRTLQADNSIYQHLMGRNDQLSFLDISMLNNYYRCDDQCTTELNCTNGGYRTSQSCDQCFCPSGFGGPTCKIRAGSDRTDDDCGATLWATSEWGTIISGAVENCTWWIVAGEDKQVEVKIMHLSRYKAGYGCPRGGIEIKLDHPFVQGFKACGNYRQVIQDTYVSRYRTAVINKWVFTSPHFVQIQYREVSN